MKIQTRRARRLCSCRPRTNLCPRRVTSAVDLKSERLIQDSLLARGRYSGRIIAYRISMLDMCYRFTLRDGRLDAFETSPVCTSTMSTYSNVAALADGCRGSAHGALATAGGKQAQAGE
jgi:hypothetical protein